MTRERAISSAESTGGANDRGGRERRAFDEDRSWLAVAITQVAIDPTLPTPIAFTGSRCWAMQEDAFGDISHGP
jgi:hypothetical protein